LYYGIDKPLPETYKLHAGLWTLHFESGDLRAIKLGDREVLQRVYVAVRDRYWNTIPACITDLQVLSAPDSFQISYRAHHQHQDIDFMWLAHIVGDAAGTIIFSMNGLARSTFLRNRIGFCILHPMQECAGLPCHVTHTDGMREQSRFPYFIAPHQPFSDIQSIAYEGAPGVTAEVHFAGDTFEMEDQRNWTDASFKTYCPPLARRFPVEVCAGTTITQSVRLTMSGALLPLRQANATPLTVSVGTEPVATLPSIGLGLASDASLFSRRHIRRLRALHLGHLRVDLRLTDPDYPSVLRRATFNASSLDAPLEIAVFVSDAAQDELEALLAVLANVKPSIWSWLVFHTAEQTTSERWMTLARSMLSRYDPTAAIGGGTNEYFTELNRERPPAHLLDEVCYSINPQVHASDNTSLIESLAAQAATVASARQFVGDVPIVVSPITLKPRFNPHAGANQPPTPQGEIPPQVDVRQMSLFGAGWTLGSIKRLAESGVARLTYYEAVGWRGVMEHESGPPLPDRFPALSDCVFPMYHVFADVGEYAGGEVWPSRSSQPLLVESLALCKQRRIRIILSSLCDRSQQVLVTGVHGSLSIRELSTRTAASAMQDPASYRAKRDELHPAIDGTITVQLLPYSIVTIDCTEEAWNE
jgi:hypothetical protein